MAIAQSPSRSPAAHAEQGLDLWSYVAVLRRRWAFFLIPLLLVSASGFAVVMLMKPVFLAEARILVESQQIPAELVRPTVTATAKERIQVIEQRVMTRENLLSLVDKYRLFPDQRQSLSGTQLLDKMRQSTKFQPFELDQARRRDGLIALTVSFEYEQPEIAMRIANELITLILNEDARNRSNRAQETTNFLAREVKKLETELGAVEAQISELKRRYSAEPISEKAVAQLAELRADYQEKSALFSSSHPDIVRLKRQIAALEKMVAQMSERETGLEALQNQRASIQKNLESASQKLIAGRLGESLERAQFSERLEVLEQAIVPQKPFKPNRPKLLLVVLALAIGTSIALVVIAETLDTTLRGTRDIAHVCDPYLVAAIPYLATKKEIFERRAKAIFATGTMAAAATAGVIGVHVFVRPLDQLWFAFMVRLFG
jgi:uncharacterized protein involved in exopolysaccharide biosynthesis